MLHIKRNNLYLPYTIDRMQLRKARSYVDLEVTANQDLTWSKHIGSICRRANSFVYLIRKTFASASFANSIRLYTTYIRPMLEYAVALWCPVLVRDHHLLEAVQSSDIFLRTGLLPFEQRCLREDLILSLRIMKFNHADPRHLFVINHGSRTRGHRLKLR